jgi:peptidyl-prolyl cis-trans isomerase C
MTQFFKTPWALLSAVAAAVLVMTACTKGQPTVPPAPKADAKPAPVPVATVGGNAISHDEYDFFVKSLTHGKTADTLNPDQKAQVLDMLIDTQVAADQGLKDGVDKDPDVAAAIEVTRLSILKDAEQRKYLADKQPSDEELHAEYDSAVAGFDKTEYHAMHILVKDKDLADQLTKKLKAGAKFEDLAKANSVDPGSKVKGGDLGWFSAGRMVKPFADALKGMKKGETTAAPVQTQFGWHIIRLVETRDAPPPPFDQVKEQVKNRVLEKKWQAYLDGFKKAEPIEKKL